MSINQNLHIDIDIDDLKYRYDLKTQLKEVIDLIPKDEGLNTISIFLENLRLRL